MPADDATQKRGNDPLGVIERAAKQLWKERGEPAGSTWQDYFSEAEELLLAGRTSDGVTVSQGERAFTDPQLVPPEIWALRDQATDPFASAIAWSVNERLSKHESFCLAMLLSSNDVKVSQGKSISPTDDTIIGLLASLSGEYDEEFLNREGRGKLEIIPREKRSEYWRAKLEHWRDEDQALSFHDRNTIARIRDTIIRHPYIDTLHPRGSHS